MNHSKMIYCATLVSSSLSSLLQYLELYCVFFSRFTIRMCVRAVSVELHHGGASIFREAIGARVTGEYREIRQRERPVITYRACKYNRRVGPPGACMCATVHCELAVSLSLRAAPRLVLLLLLFSEYPQALLALSLSPTRTHSLSLSAKKKNDVAAGRRAFEGVARGQKEGEEEENEGNRGREGLREKKAKRNAPRRAVYKKLC